MNIVKELRKKKGVQQKELAITIGVSQPIVSEWESNKKDPSGERLKKLAEFFDVDELMILGKGIVEYGKENAYTPKTVQARSLAKGMDTMPEEQRNAIMNMMTGLYPGVFEEYLRKENDDET